MKDSYAYKMGFDAGKNGPNETNSHYSLFFDHSFIKQWELGYDDGMKAKNS